MEDRLSDLPDELLVKMLSEVEGRVPVDTGRLSHRWRSLWRELPRLRFDLSHHNHYLSFARFVDRFLLFQRPPLQCLQIIIPSECDIAVDLGIWIRTAIERSIRELDINLCGIEFPVRLPHSLYTCTSLRELTLENLILPGTSTYDCFLLLKSLTLTDVIYPTEQSLTILLSSCSSLEVLDLQTCPGDNVKGVNIALPFLVKLTIYRYSQDMLRKDEGFIINTPSVKLLDLIDHFGGVCSIEHMPQLGEGNVELAYESTQKLIGSLTSAKCLSLCLMPPKVVYPSKVIFSQLVRLEICPCGLEWCNLMIRFVEASPNLRFLKLYRKHNGFGNASWEPPVSVPGCFSHLESLEWEVYDGTEDQKGVAKYVLRHAISLKKASFFPSCLIGRLERPNMIRVRNLQTWFQRL